MTYLGVLRANTSQLNVLESNGFGQFAVHRSGWRWEIVRAYPDGYVRSTYVGLFWRKMTALRIAQGMFLAYSSGKHEPQGVALER